MGTPFDRYQDRYHETVQHSIDFLGQDADFFMEVKALRLLDLARRYFGDPKSLTVLDVGCGIGVIDRILAKEFGRLMGVDTSKGLISVAAERNRSVEYQAYDGSHVPYPDASFDFVFAINVLHHVPISEREAFIQEIGRVARRGGLVAMFEHNPINPLTRLAVHRCEFDAGVDLIPRRRAKRLFASGGLEIVESRYILFFPFRGRFFYGLETWLGWLPLGAQYCVTGRK